MILKNNTTEDVSVFIKGKQYSVSAGGKVTVTNDIGMAWKKIHEFLLSESEQETEEVKEVKEEKEEKEVQEVKEVKETKKKVTKSNK
ncbi:MAG TPA: hypothetical protein PKV66_01520 [Candidatus Pelethenecus sp.]|nr:hypothetical protein [Candidatus Pelethenecus sp.]